MQKIHLTLENLLAPTQQIILQLRHGIEAKSQNPSLPLPLATVIHPRKFEFHLFAESLVLSREHFVERHIHLPWSDYERKRDPADHGKILSCEHDRLCNGLIHYLLHQNKIHIEAMKVIYHAYDGYGQLLYRHPITETSFLPHEEIKNFLHQKLLAIQEYFHSQNLPACSAEEKCCDTRCPVRMHCSQHKKDIEEEEKRIDAWHQEMGLPPI